VKKATMLAAPTLLRRQLPAGASLKITVVAASKRYCSVAGGKLKAVKAGTCRATVAVTPRQGRTVRVTVSFTVVN